MELYRFVSETEIEKYEGGFVVLDDRIHTNPTSETIENAGFKPLADVEKPEYDQETESLSLTYIDGDVITPVYTVMTIDA